MAKEEEKFEIKIKSATLRDYDEMMDDRPYKFDWQAADYVEVANPGEATCDGCQHFYKRVIENYYVCEVMRPIFQGVEKTVRPKGRCKFQTKDGKKFPLYKGVE